MGRFAIHKLDIAAIVFAFLLSAACFARGAVHDIVIAVLLLGCIPILFVAISGTRTVHHALKNSGIILLACLLLVIFIQQYSSGYLWWMQIQSAEMLQINPASLQDRAVWIQSIGRLLFLVFSFTISLCIGSSESSTRLFFQALLASSVFFLAITFFVITSSDVPSSPYRSFSHGFVNSNNAASYLGILLLLALAQSVRFFKRPAHLLRKPLSSCIEQLNIVVLIKGFFLLFSLLLIPSALFMTGSRAGIFFSVLCSFFFVIAIILKTSAGLHTRKWLAIISGVVAVMALVAWSLINFGQGFLQALQQKELDSQTRLEIFSAVLPMIHDHLWVGAGIGNFPAMFQQYRPKNISADGIIDKAHNSYLEFTAEMGLPAFMVLMAVLVQVGYMLYVGYKGRKERYITPALGLVVWLLVGLHSLVDFPLQIPAIAALFVAIVTISASQADVRFSDPSHTSKNPAVTRLRIRKRKGIKPKEI